MNRAFFIALLGSVAIAVPASTNRAEAPNSPEAAFPLTHTNYVLAGIRDYSTWYRPTDILHTAPRDCTPGFPVPAARQSDAVDSSPHGRKLYYLFVKKPWVIEVLPNESVKRARSTYSTPPLVPQPVGQVIVKESWSSEVVDYDEVTRGGLSIIAHHAIDDENKLAFRAGEQQELFVMMKLDPATPETDNGWVYGVLTPDGKQVLKSGRIESCMKCHVKAPHDRLFGLK